MKHSHRLTVLLFALIIPFFTGCHKAEEFYIKGKVIYAGLLCSTYNLGYLIEVETPQGIGDTVTLNGKLYHNAVMGYRAPRIMKDGEEFVGVAYEYPNFAQYNCQVVYFERLPQLFMLSVDEDPSVLESSSKNRISGNQ